MRKLLSVIIAVMLAVVPMFGCSGEDKTTVEISLNQTNINMTLFGETDLVASYQNVESITWSNSNEKVVKLDKNGDSVKVIAIGSGVATITATGADKSASCIVSVSSSTQRLSLSTNGYDSVTLRENGAAHIPATVSFNGDLFTKANISYKVADSSVATVDENGNITAVGVGQTEVSIRAEYYGVYSNEKKVNIVVVQGPLLKINAAFISLYATDGQDDTTIFPNRFPINVSIIDGETQIDDVNYTAESTNLDVANIKDGVIESVGVGDATINISYEYQGTVYTATVSVQIKSVPLASLTLEEETLTLFNSAPTAAYRGQYQLSAVATLDGKAVPSTDLTWKVEEGEDVVSISQKGIVKKITQGTAKVSVNYSYGGKSYTDTCTVYVVEPISYMQSHRLYKREGIYATVYKDTQFVYDEITLTNDKDVPFIKMNMIPDKLLVNEYTWGSNPQAPDSRDNRNVQFIYITLTEIDNESNYMTVGVRINKDNWDAETKYSQVGASASTFPTIISGKNGDKHFFGANVKSANSYLGNSGGWGKTAYHSFYGKYLSDVTDYYTIGFSLEGTTVYMHNQGKVEVLWDLNEDTKALAQTNPELISAENAWSGFSSNKVKLTISGGSYDTNSFNFALLGIAGHAVTASDLENMHISG